MYAPLFAKLTPEASEKLLKGNYERLFDEARVNVRAWEKANADRPAQGGSAVADFRLGSGVLRDGIHVID